MRYHKEHRTIQQLSKEIIAIVDRNFGKPRRLAIKSSPGDLVTDLDKLIDRIITQCLTHTFPGDHVVSEESSAPVAPEKGRAWVIDPICGTSNLVQGIRFLATNIALMQDGKVNAAWVIDHARQRVIFGLGDRRIWCDHSQTPRIGNTHSHTVMIVDRGYWWELTLPQRKKYISLIHDLLLLEKTSVRIFASSLPFTYVATGQLDAAVTINVRPWDLLAPCFLIEQNGGIATNFDGSPYDIRSRSVVMARNKRIHALLLKLLSKHKLNKVR